MNRFPPDMHDVRGICFKRQSSDFFQKAIDFPPEMVYNI